MAEKTVTVTEETVTVTEEAVTVGQDEDISDGDDFDALWKEIYAF